MKDLEHNPGATPALPQVASKPGPKAPELAGEPGPSPAMGPDTAKVKVFVFSDFQCPVCKRAVEPTKQVVRLHPGEVQIVFKHNALEMHPRATEAAAASLAAFRQGKFWEYHDALFADQRHLEDEHLVARAQALGLDLERFDEDRNDPAIRAQIVYERQVAERLEARGTPAFFINGARTVGWGSYGGFRGGVERALGQAKSIAAAGIAPAEVAVSATRASGDIGKLLAELLWGVK